MLDTFLPPVRAWFEETFGRPTPVQEQGWPRIAAGAHTLLLAPTGSGKTLAAFLACLDQLWRQPKLPRHVHVLYISPLKALNNDIYRNLDIPLRGVEAMAERQNHTLPKIEVGLRTGDTPLAERQRLVRKPPHILITTPESLHLMLTSRARETLRQVSHVIIDEIHALCPNKRGVFLALLLERLEALRKKPKGEPGGVSPRSARQNARRHSFVRIGLSATQRPLDEVARFLGGGMVDQAGRYHERPVQIVDAGLRKRLDLAILNPVKQFGPLPEKTVWPSIYRLLADLIRSHRSTIVFANNRRTVERLTAQLQEVLAYGEYASMEHNIVVSSGEPGGVSPRSEAPEAPPPLVKAHHGSVALEVRQETERALKEGRVRAVIATASLELGIDMGAVDLVCQVESPGNVARALQRVGRAGHIVGQSSKGRLIPKTLSDLLEEAVLAKEMAAGNVEELRVPANCLDVLAQQIVAMVAIENWDIPALYRTLRQAYPFRDLTAPALDSVLEMISGRYRFSATPAVAEGKANRSLRPGQTLSALQPRVSWDRVHQRLHALPGSQRLAVTQGGTIPDTGQYAVYTERGLRIGELDEEFVYERRNGDTFLLGTSAWRIARIDVDRVVVEPAAGHPALVPFWRGEQGGRSYDLGYAQARFLGELARGDDADCLPWLQRDHFLDKDAAANLRDYVRRQAQRTGRVPDEKTLLVEAARDPLGDWQVVLHAPFGHRFTLTLALALENLLRRRLGYRPQCLAHDDGVFIRLTESDEPVLDLLNGLSGDNVKDLVLEALADSALFALRFRQNAARALLMPRAGMSRRSPLWLQRLRGRDLLQVARQFPDFPIVVETFRECLHDHLDLPRVEAMLTEIAAGKIEVHTCRLEAPSPFAAGLWFAFNADNQYEYDQVDGAATDTYQRLDQSLLDQLVSDGGRLPLDRRAVAQVERRLRNVGRPPRSAAETAEWLRRVGDLSPTELEGPMEEFIAELLRDGRALPFELSSGPHWILREEEGLYRHAFSRDGSSTTRDEAAATILQRFLHTHALVSLADVIERYGFDPGWAKRKLEEWTQTGRAVVIPPSGADFQSAPVQFSAPENMEQLQRGTLALLRREITACSPQQFADFQLRWQGLFPLSPVAGERGRGEGGRVSENVAPLPSALDKLEGLFLPADLWEDAILTARVPNYLPCLLDDEIAGRRLWTGKGDEPLGPGAVAFFTREHLPMQPPPPAAATGTDDPGAGQVLSCLQARGALFVVDLCQQLDLPPSQVRAALWRLVRLGLATNDGMDVLRRGETLDPAEEPPAFRSPARLRAFLRGTTRPSPGAHAARLASLLPEGRWSLVPWARPDMETQAVFQAGVLLQRHGIVTRELALLDERMPPWRILYEVFSRMEMAGEARRGFFVDGLSGAQFALPAAADLLQSLLGPTPPAGAPVLLSSLDPANLYSTGLLPVPGRDDQPFTRRPGNWLILQDGAPVLLIEQQGRKLTTPPGVSEDRLAKAIRLLPAIVNKTRRRDPRYKLSVETWNDEPATTMPARGMLEAAGFVRDYQAMTWYAAWHTADATAPRGDPA
ncbi:MAG: DEAD/DEAH box helicase [Gemmataceae bacterium]